MCHLCWCKVLILFASGGQDSSYNYHDDVLNFNITGETWTQVGSMMEPRDWHGASVVQLDQIIDYCN